MLLNLDLTNNQYLFKLLILQKRKKALLCELFTKDCPFV